MKTPPIPEPGWEAFSRLCNGKEAVRIAFLLPFHPVPGKNAGKPGEMESPHPKALCGNAAKAFFPCLWRIT